MNRHKRRKLARARKEAKAAKLNARAMMVLREELRKRNLGRAKPSQRKGSGCLGNRGIYKGFGVAPLPGFGTGAFKQKPQGERSLREARARERS